MLRKWKYILTNWINCYFNEANRKEQCVSLESLITIISHLRENLNLDESQSSVLEAHTVEEFVREKYPEFHFENGSVEATNEEEVYIVASLLLFFVCVSSKDVDIKVAMCSKLSSEDQETILKFSKSLMECSPISYRDVQAAITEACGQDIAAGEVIGPRVGETPPALRSLHSEVRRLQAALDAERFDRNYLQEELARNNMRMEKLLKDKEQCKLDIVNLKAKISMCCGQEAEVREGDGPSGSLARLQQQLRDLEERLGATQEHLDDAHYQRDLYKSKVDELKQERDKWLAVSQHETSRAGQLADELDTERRHVQSLRELVNELRQHNQKNCLDSSQLECDDPDASVRSLHNSSVCSEACANVVEVQLGEERAKIVVLQQQIQELQDQFNELTQKAEDERQNLERIVSERDTEIFNLKHRINEEIEEKNHLKAHYSDEISKLNNDINELEQMLKDNNESSRQIINQKMLDIQTLQEEKLSLLQSLSDETTKLENLIKNLKTDIDTEKNLKLKMKEDYENHFMKLNEKVLNRNNELVELQNNVFEKSEMIEQLHLDLRKEKELKEDLSKKYDNDVTQLNNRIDLIENNLHQKCEEAKELQKRLSQNLSVFTELNKEIDDWKTSNAKLTENCRLLEETKLSLLTEIEKRENDVEEIKNQLENVHKLFSEEKEELEREIEEKTATIDSLQTQLRDEIKYKTGLQNELALLEQARSSLTEEVKQLIEELSKLRSDVLDKDRTIYALDLYLKEEKHTNKTMKEDCDKANTQLIEFTIEMNEKLNKVVEDLATKHSEFIVIKEKLDCSEEELRNKENVIESKDNKLASEVSERNALKTMITAMNEQKDILDKDLTQKCTEMLQLQENYKKMSQVVENNNLLLETMEKKLEVESKKYLELVHNSEIQISILNSKLDEAEKIVLQSQNIIKQKESIISELKMEIEKLQTSIESEKENSALIRKENEELVKQLDAQTSINIKIVDEVNQLKKEIAAKNVTIQSEEKEVQALRKIVEDKTEGINVVKARLAQEVDTAKDLIHQKDVEIQELKAKIGELNSVTETTKELTHEQESEIKQLKKIIDELQSLNTMSKDLTSRKESEIITLKTKLDDLRSFSFEFEQELKKDIEIKTQSIEVLQKENEQLHFTIEEDNSNHELMVKEKDAVIERLEEHLSCLRVKLQSIQKDYEDQTFMWENSKIQIQDNLLAKDNQITKLKEQVTDLENALEQTIVAAANAKAELKMQLDDIISESNKTDLRRKEQIIDLIAEVTQNEMQLTDVEHATEVLKQQLEKQKTSKESLEIDNKKLIKENESIIEQLSNVQSAFNTTSQENTTFLNEKTILTQELLEERSLRKMMEEEKLALLAEKEVLLQKLREEQNTKNCLLEEKECLTQQMIEEKSTKEHEQEILQAALSNLEEKFVDYLQVQEQLEKENCYLSKEKSDLIQETNRLSHQLIELTNVQEKFLDEKITIIEMLDEEKIIKEELLKEKDSLIDENVSLKAMQEVLSNDKEILLVEKDTLLQSLNEEKAVRDEIENEKKSALIQLKELKGKYKSELHENQEELKNTFVELKLLRTDFKKHEDNSVKIASVLNSGLEKLLQNLTMEDISNEVLKKLLTIGNHEEMAVNEKCDLLINIADTLTTELSLRRNLEKALEHESVALNKLKEMIKQKEMQVLELQTEVKRLQQVAHENKIELSKQTENLTTTLESKLRDMQKLELENKSLNNELNDVKVQLEVKVHSLKEKLIDNENLTDKLKKTYECQIDNLNLMITKLTSYLKDKTVELDSMRKEKERLQQVVEDCNKVTKSLDEEIKNLKLNQEKIISDFESERLVLKNMVTVTESVMEDQKLGLNKTIAEHVKVNESLLEDNKALQELIDTERKSAVSKLQEKEVAFESVFKDLTELRNEKDKVESDVKAQKELFNKEIVALKKDIDSKQNCIDSLESQNKELAKEYSTKEKDFVLQRENLEEKIKVLNEEVNLKASTIETLEVENKDLNHALQTLKQEMVALEKQDNELKIKKDSLEFDLLTQIDELTKVLKSEIVESDKSKSTLQEKLHSKVNILDKVKILSEEIIELVKEKNEFASKLDELKTNLEANELKADEQITSLKKDNLHLVTIIEENKTVIANLEQLIQHELEQNQKLRQDTADDKVNLDNKCSLLQEYQCKAEVQLEERQKEINSLKLNIDAMKSSVTEEVEGLKLKLNDLVEALKVKDDVISKLTQEKDAIISSLSVQLVEEKATKEQYQKELESKVATLYELRQKLEDAKNEAEVLEGLRKDNEDMIVPVVQRESYAASHEKISSHKFSGQTERDLRDRHQVSTPTSDLTHSSLESFKTITDLEKIIHDKNRTITTLQSDITFMKSLMADSENKLLDVSKELEVTRENCQQLSFQLKKTVQQKNEEIAELKKHMMKMSVTENRATQIIKVSAKYQAIILKRIAEIKSNTILKELTNFGNTQNSDNELKRSLNSGAITMEDLENFLETTDRHLKRCSEKQLALQKERDRLTEVNRINESEIINLKKFLTELSVSFKTFSSIKEMYSQKLSRVVSVQRTVRREILNLDGHITDATMCKLERGYAAVMQDLAECAMNLERWVERCLGRTISPEKIKQAFTSDTDRASLASTTFQNTSLEVQLIELDNSFQKLLEEVARAQKGEGAKEAQAVTVMEVRAEYEDKLNRMKAKMKELYQEQIAVFKEKQKEEIATLEREVLNARENLAESSRAYEKHIKSLTAELWNVGEKFLMKKDEAEWLRRKQRAGSLMSLQDVHSAGLAPPRPEEIGRPSDTHSLRSLPVHNNTIREKREGRGLHMSDEEGEVFDNRWLKELSATPRREPPAGLRLSELRWRNSLCPPHLKSSYPAETQFAPALDEEDIKFTGAAAANGGKQPRKEVGITAYKKPGPPTPSKQAGRLSATDCELRESLRVEAEPQPRKTSTPSRFRALFRPGRSNDSTEGTPRTRRLSNIFRKK